MNPIRLSPMPGSTLPPSELDGDKEARKEWLRIVPELRSSRVVTVLDRGLLIALCLEWSRLLEFQRLAKRTKHITKHGTGGVGISPYATLANRALGNLVRMWAEIGATPSARTRIATVEQPVLMPSLNSTSHRRRRRCRSGRRIDGACHRTIRACAGSHAGNPANDVGAYCSVRNRIGHVAPTATRRVAVCDCHRLKDHAFTAAELWTHAACVESELHAVFADADIRSARRLGKRLEKLQAVDYAGVKLERIGLEKAGVVWTVKVSDHFHLATSQTRAPGV